VGSCSQCEEYLNINGFESNSFYVTELINFSMKAYPNNTIAAFTVQLAHEIDLVHIGWRWRFVSSQSAT